MSDHVPAATSVLADMACLDGELAPASETAIPVTDEGFIRGDGAFEVIRIYEGRPFAIGDHLDRLEHSVANLRLGFAVPRAEIEQELGELLRARGDDFDGLLRVVITRGGRRLLMTEPRPPSPERVRLTFVTYSPTRILDGVKSLSYAGNMLATRIARERGFDEALLVTPHGRVLEAPTSSIFWAGDDGVLRTPPLSEHILASITRDRLMQLIEVEETPLTTDELLRAREAFLCSTTREGLPVAAVEEREFPEVGDLTKKAGAALRAHIQSELG